MNDDVANHSEEGGSADLRLLFLTKNAKLSAPEATAIRAMARTEAATCAISNGLETRDTLQWVKLSRKYDAVVVVSYAGPSTFIIRQLALATAAGVGVVRWWVGTDVLNAVRYRAVGDSARELARITVAQIAVSPHLALELESVSVKAEFIPSMTDVELTAPTAECDFMPRTLLVYLPSDRWEFYGGRLIEQLVANNSDIRFVIVSDENHRLKRFSNVESLGWVSDMETIWNQVGGLLRITEHDGMPRMVMDALARGKHVIYSWQFEGCRLATTLNEVQSELNRFKAMDDRNDSGPAYLKNMLSPDPAVQFARRIQEATQTLGWRSRLRAVAASATCTYRMKVGMAVDMDVLQSAEGMQDAVVESL